MLEQLFASLRRAGLLKSQRGVHGGYSFAKRVDEISVLDVVECVDGAVRRPPDATSGPSAEVWQAAREALAEILAAETIGRIAEREAQADSSLMFHI